MTDDELRQLIESNARAVQANSESIAQSRASSEAADQRLRESIDATNQQLRESIDATNQQLRESSEAADQRLRDAITDTVAMIADLAQQQQVTDERFSIFLEESRADRQRSDERAAANDTEHRAFQQITQTLLAEISRIWQRLAS